MFFENGCFFVGKRAPVCKESLCFIKRRFVKGAFSEFEKAAPGGAFACGKRLCLCLRGNRRRVAGGVEWFASACFTGSLCLKRRGFVFGAANGCACVCVRNDESGGEDDSAGCVSLRFVAVPRAPNPFLQRKITRDKPSCRNLGAQLLNSGANPRENGVFSRVARLTNDVFVGILILRIVTGSDREE